MKTLVNLCLTLCLSTILISSLTGCAGNRNRESTGEYIDDSAITAKVKTALLADKDVSGMAVKVETYKRIVQLSGFVDTPQQKDRAGEVARTISGVEAVKNDIVVK